LHLERPEKGLLQSSTEVPAAGHSANPAILVDNIEVSKAQGLAQAGLLVHLLRAGEVLPAAFVVAVSLETLKAAGALEALTEEVKEEVTGEAMEEVMEEAAMAVAAMAVATGKLKDNVSEEGPMRSFFLLSNSCWNPEFHTFVIQVKVGLPEKPNPSMRRGWEATALLREGKLPIKNFGVAFCEKRPHFFLLEVNI